MKMEAEPACRYCLKEPCECPCWMSAMGEADRYVETWLEQQEQATKAQ